MCLFSHHTSPYGGEGAPPLISIPHILMAVATPVATAVCTDGHRSACLHVPHIGAPWQTMPPRAFTTPIFIGWRRCRATPSPPPPPPPPSRAIWGWAWWGWGRRCRHAEAGFLFLEGLPEGLQQHHQHWASIPQPYLTLVPGKGLVHIRQPPAEVGLRHPPAGGTLISQKRK